VDPDVKLVCAVQVPVPLGPVQTFAVYELGAVPDGATKVITTAPAVAVDEETATLVGALSELIAAWGPAWAEVAAR
jgi:hypothetical protein